LTVKDGVFSLLKGDSPFHSRPARFKFTRRPTTCDTGNRARISSKNESENFIAGLGAASRCKPTGLPRLITVIHYRYQIWNG
jgi:hypothetical protein